MRNSSLLQGKGLSLRAKMMILLAAAFAGMIIVAVISTYFMNEVRIGGSAYKTIRQEMNALESMALLKADLFRINTEIQEFTLKTNKEAIGKKIALIKNLTNDIDLKFGVVMGSVESSTKREAIDKANTIWKEYKKTLLDEILPAVVKNGALGTGHLLSGVQARRFSAFSNTIALMVEDIRMDVDKTEEMASVNIRTKIFSSLLITLIVIVVVVFFLFVVTTSITQSLRNCVEFAHAIADGRLDTRLETDSGNDTRALEKAMNIMAGNLRGMVKRIRSASEALIPMDNNIEKAARQLAKSAHLQETMADETSQALKRLKESALEVSGGIDKLSLSVSETSSSTLEMTAGIEEAAINADMLGKIVNEVSSPLSR